MQQTMYKRVHGCMDVCMCHVCMCHVCACTLTTVNTELIQACFVLFCFVFESTDKVLEARKILMVFAF